MRTAFVSSSVISRITTKLSMNIDDFFKLWESNKRLDFGGVVIRITMQIQECLWEFLPLQLYEFC